MSSGTWQSRMGPRPAQTLPRLERVAVRWRVQGPSHRVYECVEFAVATGFELRVQRDDEDILISQLFRVRGAALEQLAETWRRGALATGFKELP